MRFGAMSLVLLFGLILARPHAAAEEATSFRLPNGLELRALHLANTGTVRARLVFSIREGLFPRDPVDEPLFQRKPGDRDKLTYTPKGTAFLMSKVLPLLGCAGIDRMTFEGLKDRSGVLSLVEAGSGWISWTFESLPSNAEMMIQLLADEALRPAWLKSTGLQEILDRVWERDQFYDARDEAANAFRDAAGDAAAAHLPRGRFDPAGFVALWSAAVRRPERAVLCVVGDVESIPLRRAVAQHFGPWAGPRSDAHGSAALAPPATHREKPEHIVIGTGATEVWAAWDLGAFPPGRAESLAALIPWLLRAMLPMSDNVIQDLEIGTCGQWARAVGADWVSLQLLEAHLKELLATPLTKDKLDAALKARDEHARADALHPHRMLERLGLPDQDTDHTPPTLEELADMLAKCMDPDKIEVLLVR